MDDVPRNQLHRLVWAGLLIAGGMVLNVGMGRVVDLSTTDPKAAGSAWFVIESIGNSLSGQIEIVGAIWILLVSLSALRTRALPAALNYLGVVMAVSALATVIPALEMVAVVFGLGLIVWFGWVGIILVRNAPISGSSEAGPARAPRIFEDELSR